MEFIAIYRWTVWMRMVKKILRYQRHLAIYLSLWLEPSIWIVACLWILYGKSITG